MKMSWIKNIKQSDLRKEKEGSGLSGFVRWKSATDSIACLSLDVGIHEVSSSVPS